MDYFLVTSGIALIIFALWSNRLRDDNQKKELEKYQQLQNDLADAKKEVNVLLKQLETASEKIVEEISFGLEEIESTAQGWLDKMSQQSSAVSVEPTVIQTTGRTIKNTNTVVFPKVKLNEDQQKSFAEVTQSHEEQMPRKHQMVCSMAGMGYSEEEIAKQMSIGKGEVRLILKLKRKGEEANA